MIDKNELISVSHGYGIAVSESEADMMDRYCEALIEKNRYLNLTAITDAREVMVKHILDSLLCADLSYVGKDVADVGTGGGFPGVPLKIHCPESNVTLIDSTGKKLDFISETCGNLGIDINCVHGRAEELGRKKLRESFDTVTARAVANMQVLSELCLPLVRVGGYFIAMKGADGEAELAASQRAIRLLGGSVKEVIDLELPDSAGRRTMIVIKKETRTPDCYPRGGSNITKKPL